MASSLLRRGPKLLYPIDLTDKPRGEDLVCKLCARNLERDDVTDLVSLGRRSIEVICPLAERPSWEVRLRRDV